MLQGHAMTAVTALTAQNTLGVRQVTIVPPEMVIGQMDAVIEDLGVDAVKIGMVGSPETANLVAERLAGLDEVPIVFDPVMVSTSGAALASAATVDAFQRLMILADLVTPNAPELTALTGIRIETLEQLVAAARLLADRTHAPILAKGGHLPGRVLNDVLIDRDGSATRWEDERIESRHTHGTGCTLASAIATELARGTDLKLAITAGRRFVRAAIAAAPGFGQGAGPMGHWAVRDSPPD
jgi:hydroxymethylpyrimidine/phosphomethylpyrimidine kinase